MNYGMKLLIHSQLQRCSRWTLVLDRYFHPTPYRACDYLSMLISKLIGICKRGSDELGAYVNLLPKVYIAGNKINGFSKYNLAGPKSLYAQRAGGDLPICNLQCRTIIKRKKKLLGCKYWIHQWRGIFYICQVLFCNRAMTDQSWHLRVYNSYTEENT